MFVDPPGNCPAYPYLKTALHVHADSDDTTQHNIIENWNVLFQKRVVCTKFNIYVFITISGSIPLLVEY